MFERTIKPAQTDDVSKQKHHTANFVNNSLSRVSSNFFDSYPVQRKADCSCGGSCPRCQAKHSNLPISQPNDAAEIEADNIADKIMRMTTNSLEQVKTLHSKPQKLQRKCDGCDEVEDVEADYEDDYEVEDDEDEHETEGVETVFRKEKHTLNPFHNGLSIVPFNSGSHSGGNPLSREAKSFFEPRFGRDFNNVRVHTDSQAADSAQSVNAKAYTIGNHIVFGQGEYSPNSEAGKKLLAHELVHTIQQDSKQIEVQRQKEKNKTEEKKKKKEPTEKKKEPTEKKKKDKPKPPPNPCTRTILWEGSCEFLVKNSKWVCCDPDNGIENQERTSSAVKGESDCDSKKWTPIFTCDHNCDNARKKGCDDNDNWIAAPPKSFKCGDVYTICANGKQTTGYVRDKSVTEKSYEVSTGIQKTLGVPVGSSFKGSIYKPGANQSTIDKDKCCKS